MRSGRVYNGTRVDVVWSDDAIARYLAAAPTYMHLPLMLALWTGQREADLLSLRWDQYDGTHIRLAQSKTRKPVTIKIGEPLRRALDAIERIGPTILVNRIGEPFKANTLQEAFQAARAKAKLAPVTLPDGTEKRLTFADLRGTAVTRLALAGCTEAEIANVTGHSLRQVNSILEKHYLHRDPRIGDNAIRKLEAAYPVLQNAAK